MADDLLQGIRVVDWTTMAAGPGATAILSEIGATVDKVEPITGDPWRNVGVVDGASCVFEFDNDGSRQWRKTQRRRQRRSMAPS